MKTSGNFIVKNTINNTYLTSNVEYTWSEKREDALVFDSYIDAGKYETTNIVVNKLRTEQKTAYPDIEADGYVFCGKCGKMK